MALIVRVESALGTVYGPGPITTVQQWTSTSRLNRAGSFSFTMSASDPRAALLVRDYFVRCLAAENFGRRTIAIGIIKQVQMGPDFITVSGPDLLHELTYRTVELDLYEDVWVSPSHMYLHLDSGATTTAMPNAIDGNTGTSHTGIIFDSTLTVNDFVYARTDNPVHQADFTFGTFKNRAPGTGGLKWQWPESESAGWSDFQLSSDGTNDGTRSYAQNGIVAASLPDAWLYGEFQSVAGFWTRFSTHETNATMDMDWAEVELLERRAATADLAPIIALAPSGWSVVTNTTTGIGTRYRFTGETVLAALIRIADLHGQAFRVAATARQVQWLRSAVTSTNLTAIPASAAVDVEANNAVVLITDFDQITDAYERYSRIIARGAGQGDNRLHIGHATDAAPAGYTKGQDSQGRWYLKHDATETAIGQRELIKDFPDIGGQTGTLAANQLQASAKIELDRYTSEFVAYNLAVTKVNASPLVGQSINLIWRDVVVTDEGTYLKRDINTHRDGNPLHILEITHEVDDEGVRVVGLQVGTQRRAPLTTEMVIEKQAREIQGLRRQVQSATTFVTTIPD